MKYLVTCTPNSKDPYDAQGKFHLVRDHSADMVATTFWVRAYGCQHNHSDAEIIRGVLEKAGYESIDSEKMPDVDMVVIVGCTVKGPSEAHFYNLTRDAVKQGKLILLAGCVTQADEGRLPNDLNSYQATGKLSIIGVQQLNKAAEVADKMVATMGLDGNTTVCASELAGVTLVQTDEWPSLSLPKHRTNPHVDILCIQSGCQCKCTYCKTTMARGRLHSYPLEEIVDYIRNVVANSPEVREIWFTGEDCAAWGADFGKTLPDLLEAVLPLLPSTMRLRVGMSNPLARYWTRDNLMERWIACYNHPRMSAFAHIPVQSGSDEVLKSMRRGYKVADYEAIVNALREGVPGICLSTDMIVGFPGETEEDHEQSMALLRRVKLPIVNISKYYARKGTPAAEMKQLPTHISKNRSRGMTNLVRSITDHHARLVGTDVEVAVVEMSSRGNCLAGRTKDYVQVLVPFEHEGVKLMGKFVKVHVLSASRHSVEGRVVSAPTEAPTMS